MAVNENGSFTKLTPESVKRLEEVFALDGSIEEACFYADISRQTYYNWINENKEMDERFDNLRQKPFLKARQTLVKNLDVFDNALKYMERKRKNEFSLRTETDLTTKGEKLETLGIPLPIAAAITKKYEEELRKSLSEDK